MNTIKISPLRERLQEIINISYRILGNKIAAGDIEVPNEASLQMQLGTILNQVGALYEFARNDHFAVKLEVPKEIEKTVKSCNGKARCDIYIKLCNGTRKAEAIIELKCFLKRKTSSETITQHRYSVLCDMENLEKYKNGNSNVLCYEILYTDNGNYSKSKTNMFTLRDNDEICSYEGDGSHAPVTLRGNYKIAWDCCEEKHYFLKVELQ